MKNPDPAPALPLSNSDAATLGLTRPHPHLLTLYTLQALCALFLAPIVFVPLYFKYHTLRYKFDEEGISATWGILFRREIYLTYKRIQDIHVKRNVIERWLGIGTVEVQTAAGSSSAELKLEGLGDYAAMRDFLYRRMRGHEMAAGASTAATAPLGSTPTPAGAPAEAEVIELLRAIQRELEGARRAIESRR
jgi:putative membrane protein